MNITKGTMAEAKTLVAEGDTNLAQLRATFKRVTNRDTKITDEQLTAASMTEDNDDQMLVDNILDIEENGLTITEDDATQAA